jgi:hypothetical protein
MSSLMQLPSSQVAALRAEDVQLYLASHGWQRDAGLSTDRGNVFRYPNIDDAEALLPTHRDVADYTERMADIVQMLAAVEQRNVWQVLADISAPPADVLRLQVTSPGTTLGALPLTEGIRLIEGGKGLLLAAACSAHQVQAFYPRQAYRASLDFLETCQLGQTERGSFVATILAPIPPDIGRQMDMFPDDQSEAALEETEPFPRKATLRLMKALNCIGESIQTGSYDLMLNGIGCGVSANLCEAITLMQPSGDQANLHVRMSWSRSRPKIPATLPSKVSFSQTAFSIIREAGRKLREQPSPSRQRIEGAVFSLKGDTSLLDGFEGTVTLRVIIGSTPVRVQVTLDRNDYTQACDAHRDGNAVAVTGLLQQEAKTYRLISPEHFQVIRS